MKRWVRFLSLVVTVIAAGCATQHAELPDLTRHVDPFVGTAWTETPTHGVGYDNGNTFPGAAYPMGMVQWSPDTPATAGVVGGYWYPDKIITGFPLTHFSGRGVKYLLDVPFLPTTRAVEASPGTHWTDYRVAFSHDHEEAHPGYYRVMLDSGIEVELTATPRTGMARIQFPSGAQHNLLIRTDSQVSISGPDQITGYHATTIGGGSRPYTVYFAARFDRPISRSGVWNGDALSAGSSAASARSCGAYVSFNGSSDAPVQVKVGVSFVSIENAQANLAAENPGWDFTAPRRAADQAWNALLNRIQVSGGTNGETRTFYTALYHCYFHPNLLDDANGQYPGMDGALHTVEEGRHQYQNIPAWDQYRSFIALRAILTPRETADIVQSLVNYAQQDAEVRPNGGGLPRWQQVNRNSAGMVGDGDDAIIATAYAFGARDFDTAGALAAMHKGASMAGTTSDGHPVREGLSDYLSLGYVPGKAAITQEYCVADFAIAQFAAALGDEEKHAYYQNRAQCWKKLFNPAGGYIEPRGRDGAFPPGFSPASTSGFVEGSGAQYLWLVNFNFRGLFDLLGGNAPTVARLDHFFVKLNGPDNSANAFMGNEPCEAAPWAYAYAGAPAKTQQVVRRIQHDLFFDRPGGLPGNDDAGAISSWYVFSALGLYPAVPGVGGLVVGSPVFPQATVRVPGGLVVRIDAAHAVADAPYVQSLAINRRKYDRPWLPWSALSKGAILQFELGKSPSDWGSAPEQAPPSFDSVPPHTHGVSTR